ncbi:helix-turn-helix domain-containing protein [Streptococcus thoraltensis]
MTNCVTLQLKKRGCEVTMISYKPFYNTLRQKGFTEYGLIFKQGLSANTIHRIKKGEAITTKTLDTLCSILECKVEDIIVYEADE